MPGECVGGAGGAGAECVDLPDYLEAQVTEADFSQMVPTVVKDKG